MKIFISHSSKDKPIVDQFVEKILILGCGMNENNIFCTSIEGLGIKTGLDFRNHIKAKLLKSHIVLLFISKNYKESDICLNEMGAAWAQDSVEVLPFIFPDVTFDSIGTLYSVKQVAIINDSSSLDDLFEELTNKNEVQKKVSRWNKNKSEFLEFVQNSSKNSMKPNDDFFNDFLQKNADIRYLFQKCHPTLLDCTKVFREQHAEHYFKAYCNLYLTQSKSVYQPLNTKYSSYKVIEITGLDRNRLTGGMNKLIDKGAFRYDAVFYKVQFLESEDSRAGLSFNYFCYLDERWVYFPKPWKLDSVL